jgi:dTDP-4-amino-4,6-dideoxygalactose transaminase
MDTIPVYKPWLDKDEFAMAEASLRMGWLGMGSYVGEFERAIHRLIDAGDRHVAAVSTGHAALHLALLTAGVGPGDEVITPSFNNIADLQAIIATGADPVFVDIIDQTLCLDLDKVEEMIGPRTKAIIAMDYACHLCDHPRVASLASAHGLRVIHDAAHAFGTRLGSAAVGSFSDISIFSFDPVKTITSIDGGAIIVRTSEELAGIHEMRLIGMKQAAKVMYGNQRAWNYDVERLGFRYHMANLHAAIGLAQIAKFDAIASTRRDLFRFYHTELSGLRGIRIPNQDVSDVVPFMFYLRILNGRRDAFRDFLHTAGVDTGIHWQPAHGFSLFRNCRRSQLGITDEVGNEIVTIPFHSNMNRTDRERVAHAVKDFVLTV